MELELVAGASQGDAGIAIGADPELTELRPAATARVPGGGGTAVAVHLAPEGERKTVVPSGARTRCKETARKHRADEAAAKKL